MTGRRGVEDDVIEVRRRGAVAEQLRELVEGGDLDGARARELLFHAGDGGGRQHVAERSDDALAVGRGRLLGIDVEHREPRNGGHGGRRRGDLDAQHLAEVRGRIGADEQHAPPRVGQGDGGRAGRRGLAHAALAREEQNTRRVLD